MKLRRVLEPTRALDEAQAEKPDMEVHVRLRPAGDQGYMVNARGHRAAFLFSALRPAGHQPLSSSAITFMTEGSFAMRSRWALTFGCFKRPSGSLAAAQRIIGRA
jgi:hypothetical protein